MGELRANLSVRRSSITDSLAEFSKVRNEISPIITTSLHDIAIRALVKDFDWLDDAQAEIAALKGSWPKWSTGQVFSPSVLFSSLKIKKKLRQ